MSKQHSSGTSSIQHTIICTRQIPFRNIPDNTLPRIPVLPNLPIIEEPIIVSDLGFSNKREITHRPAKKIDISTSIFTDKCRNMQFLAMILSLYSTESITTDRTVVYYPSGIDSFSFMLSIADVPTLLFGPRFAWFVGGDFAYTRLPVYLQRSLPGRAPSAKSWGRILLCVPHFILPCHAIALANTLAYPRI